MSQSFNYRHLFYFWVVAKEGGIARAAERLDMAMQTISAQVRELEKSLGVNRLLPPVRDEPHLRLLCHEGEFQPLLGELALHKLDAVLADRAAPPNPALRTTSQLLGSSAIAWYAPPLWAEAAANNFPHSLAVVPLLLPTDHAAMRARIDHWLER